MNWWMWLIIAALCGIIEMMSMTFFLLWVAVGAVLGMILSLLHLPLLWQIAGFCLASVALFLSTRPLMRDWKEKKTYVSRMETLVGSRGVTETAIVPGRLGMVHIAGETWSAVADEMIPRGATVIVQEVRSSLVVVKPCDDGEGKDKA